MKVSQRVKRMLFFAADRLQISKAERLSVVTMLIIVLLLSVLSGIVRPRYAYNPEEYREIEKLFREKVRQAEAEKKYIAEKYYPDTAVSVAEVDTKAELVKRDADAPPPEQTAYTRIVNINTAGLMELQSLKGIGATYARRILEYRDRNGKFNSTDELLKVKGIGKKRLESIRPFIKL